MEFKRIGVVMAGGSGERFWPVSTPDRPKQFLRLADPHKSLLEMAVERAAMIGEPFIATNTRLAQLSASSCEQIDEFHVLAEPHKRNTLGCLVWVAANLIHRNPQDWKSLSLAVLTADQKIEPLSAFGHCAAVAMDRSEQAGGISLIGIEPTRAETGFGYIETDARPGQLGAVKSFREKPSADLAQEYVNSGGFLWNSGMFFLTLSTLVAEVERQRPEVAATMWSIARKLGLGDAAGACRDFEGLPSVSFDVSIMEGAESVNAVRSTFEWDDLGSWDSVLRSQPLDEFGNAFVGNARGLDSSANVVYVEGTRQKVHLLGLEGFVVVVTSDSILVCPQSAAQGVKRLLAE